MSNLLSFLPLMLLTKDGLFNVEDNDPQVLCCPPIPVCPMELGDAVWDAVPALCPSPEHPQCAHTLLWGPLPWECVNLAASF